MWCLDFPSPFAFSWFDSQISIRGFRLRDWRSGKWDAIKSSKERMVSAFQTPTEKRTKKKALLIWIMVVNRAREKWSMSKDFLNRMKYDVHFPLSCNARIIIRGIISQKGKDFWEHLKKKRKLSEEEMIKFTIALRVWSRKVSPGVERFKTDVGFLLSSPSYHCHAKYSLVGARKQVATRKLGKTGSPCTQKLIGL